MGGVSHHKVLCCHFFTDSVAVGRLSRGYKSFISDQLGKAGLDPITQAKNATVQLRVAFLLDYKVHILEEGAKQAKLACCIMEERYLSLVKLA